MKKVLLTVLIGLCMIGFTSTAKAVVLDPIGLPASFSTGGSPTITTSAILTLNQNFQAYNGASLWFSGVLTQNVYKEAAGMLFTYQFNNVSNSVDPIFLMTTTDFTGFTTDVNQSLAGWGIRRQTDSTVGFNTSVAKNTTSPLFWIQTNAQYTQWGSTFLQDGANTTVATYGPAIPEPGSMMLLGMGILGLFGLKRKKA